MMKDRNYNSSYRIGFYEITLEEKNKIKNALGSKMFEFYDEIDVDNNLINTPDLIISGEVFISDKLQNILDYSLASLVMVSSKNEEALQGTPMFSLEDSEFDDFIRGIVRTAMFQNAIKIRVSLESQFDKDGFTLEKVDSLLSLINQKDPYTLMHSINVSDYAVMIATELGFDENTVDKVKLGGLLHDIGKICLPDSILFNTTKTLDKFQTAVMQEHSSLGTVILPDGLDDVMDMILLHHERLDGSGYPFGFDASKLSDLVRIISVADTYDAMTTKRTYQDAMTDEVAFGILYKLSSDEENSPKLDRRMVLALEKAIKKVNEKENAKVH